MFIEDRLLECATFGSAMAPVWNTRKIPLKSGIVRRNPLRSRPQYGLTLQYRVLKPDAHHEVIAAFNACLGGVHSFRVKDWSDYTADDELLGSLGTGSPQTLQLTKTYSFGSQSLVRDIKKPVAGTVVITANGVAIASSTDATTGLVTFTAALNAVVRWSGEFDVPMMFEEDRLEFTADEETTDRQLLLSADVPLVEDLSI